MIFILVALASALANTPVALRAPTGRVKRDGPVKGRRRVTKRERAEMVRLYESGIAAQAVAEQVQVSKGCVLQTLKDEGVAVRPRGNPGSSRQ